MIRRAHRGVALVEIAIALVVLAAALIPMARVFSTGHNRATMGHLQYMAIHAARAELEELRQVPFAKLAECAHGFRPLAGPALPHTIRHTKVAKALATDAALSYPRDYARIETAVEVVASAPRLVAVTVTARWQENGPGTGRGPAAISTLRTLIGDHRAVDLEATL